MVKREFLLGGSEKMETAEVFHKKIEVMYDSLISWSGDQSCMNAAQEAIMMTHSNLIECPLYTPMLSMGMSPTIILPRIKWLKDLGWKPDRIATLSPDHIAMIASSKVSTGSTFGMVHRINELVERSKDICEQGQEKVSDAIKPRENWDQKELLKAFRLLQKLIGVGPAALLHILMNLKGRTGIYVEF